MTKAATGRTLPGPRLPRLLQTLLWVTRPLEFVTWCRRRYGDCFRLELARFGELVSVSDPAICKAVFAVDAGCEPPIEPFVGSNSLALLEGERHRAHQKTMHPPLRGRRMEEWRDLILATTERRVQTWPVGQPIRMYHRMTEISLEVMIRIVFGTEDPDRLDELRGVFTRFAEDPLADRLPWILWALMLSRGFRRDLGWWSPGGQFRRRLADVDAALYTEIERQRALAESDRCEGILPRLLSARDGNGRPMTDQELRDELMMIMLSGSESTASTLAWSVDLLFHNPGTLERLLADLESGSDRYLTAVVKETLRLYPVVWLPSPRRLKEPLQAGGFWFAKDSLIFPNIYLLQRRPDLHDNPDRFEPERFLRMENPGFTWLPFGGGAHRCLGADLAMFEIGLVLSHILRRVILKPAAGPEKRAAHRALNIPPARGARVVVAGFRTPPASAACVPATGAELVASTEEVA